MYTFKIDTMTCGHCAGTVEKAARSVDPGSKVEIDLGKQVVTIVSNSPAADFATAIETAGYSSKLAG